MSGEPFNDLNLGVVDKYEGAFKAIHSAAILSASEAELADHARALASYHHQHVGQDQVAAALLIHNLHWARITERVSARADAQSRTLIRLTWALLVLTTVLLAFTVVLYKDAHHQMPRQKLAPKDTVQAR